LILTHSSTWESGNICSIIVTSVSCYTSNGWYSLTVLHEKQVTFVVLLLLALSAILVTVVTHRSTWETGNICSIIVTSVSCYISNGCYSLKALH